MAALLVTPGVAAANGTLTVSPSPAVVGDSLVFSGCGYNSKKPVYLSIQAPDYTSIALQVPGDGSGCFTTADYLFYPATETGGYTVYAFQAVGGPNFQGLLEFTVG